MLLVIALFVWLPPSLGGGYASAQAEESGSGPEIVATASDPVLPPEETVIEQLPPEPADESLPPIDAPAEAPTGAPTDIPTDTPTDVPTEASTAVPTEEPAATEPATEETEAVADPAPTEIGTAVSTSTPEPPTPFEPVIECIRPEAAQVAVAGESEWGALACALRWDTGRVYEVRAAARPRDAGWTVVLVSAAAIEQGVPLSEEDHRLEITEPAAADEEFLTARFVLGTRLECLAPLTTVLDLEITAWSRPSRDGEATLEETVSLPVEVSARQPSAPALTGMSVSFAPISNSLTGSRVSSGVVTISFEGAPERCGWAASISFDDFIAGANVIPAGQLVAVSASGVDGLDVSSESGVIWVVLPTSEMPRDSSGLIEITTELDIGSFKPQGSYGSTVTVELSLMQ